MRNLIERRIAQIAQGVGQALEVEVAATYERGYPATVSSAAETELAAAAAAVVGEDKVDRDPAPVMGAEDFAQHVQRRPGSYVFIGNGGGDEAPMVHHPQYNFNDEALPYGASYWSKLVEQVLPVRWGTATGSADPARRFPELPRGPPPRAVLWRRGRVSRTSARKPSMNFQDKRTWYIIGAVVIAIIIIWSLWPGRRRRALTDPVAHRRRQRSDAPPALAPGGRGPRASLRRTRTLSMRRPSMSTTSKRQPS